MSWEWSENSNLRFLTLPKWQAEGIEVGFSTRVGGVSQAPYDSLNLGLHVGDDPNAVLDNRKRWLEEWGVSGLKAVVGEQVHGTKVIWVNELDGGQGIHELKSAIPKVDGFVTRSSLGLMAFFADCVPLFFYYPDLKAVAIAHAGWRGTVHKIGLRVLECFESAGGCTKEAWAAIGPSIGPCCYSVDENVAAQFRSSYPGLSLLEDQKDGHYLLDLWKANKTLFIEKGIRPENIEVASICTAHHPECFFSHRRDGVRTGRMVGWIRKKDEER
jgi:YfiH family protein